MGSALWLFVAICMIVGTVRATVVVVIPHSKDGSKVFSSMDASFGPKVRPAGFCGVINPASPRDACQPFWIHPVLAEGRKPLKHIALIERGNCNFEVKVRHAQMAGYGAAVLFNNENYHDAEGLVTMSGEANGINTPAVFVSKSSGEYLLGVVGTPNVSVCIFSSEMTSNTYSSERNWFSVTFFIILPIFVAVALLSSLVIMGLQSWQTSDSSLRTQFLWG